MRRNATLRFASPPKLLRLGLIGALTLALLAPMNFVLITPGTPTPLFPKVLALQNIKSYPSDGQLFLLTIMITNPESKVLGMHTLNCWAKGDCAVAPRSLYYKRDSTDEVERESALEDMSQSQNSAVDAAANYIAAHYPSIDISNFNDQSIKVSLENTGGPSGGLIFSIGLVELLTPENILQGRKVAGTGTITADGTVGPIGGIAEKIIGAKSVGAELLFISQANCYELPAKVEGITVIAVSHLDEAIAYLRENKAVKPLNSAGIRGCASVGA